MGFARIFAEPLAQHTLVVDRDFAVDTYWLEFAGIRCSLTISAASWLAYAGQDIMDRANRAFRAGKPEMRSGPAFCRRLPKTGKDGKIDGTAVIAVGVTDDGLSIYFAVDEEIYELPDAQVAGLLFALGTKLRRDVDVINGASAQPQQMNLTLGQRADPELALPRWAIDEFWGETTMTIAKEMLERERYFAETLRAIEDAAGGDAAKLAILIAELRADLVELMWLNEIGAGKMTAHARLAAVPTLADRVAALEQRVAELEAQRDAVDDISADGAPRPGRWMKMKAAVRQTGYSESGLRKLCRLGRCLFDYRGPHLVINVDSVPRRKVSKVRKV